MRWLIGFAHGSGADVRFNSDGIGAACLVHLVKQIGQGFRIAFRSIRLGGSIRRQCFCRDDPWRNGGEEILGEKRRSEEHTSELQSLMRISYAVFCLKKKTTITQKQR